MSRQVLIETNSATVVYAPVYSTSSRLAAQLRWAGSCYGNRVADGIGSGSQDPNSPTVRRMPTPVHEEDQP